MSRLVLLSPAVALERAKEVLGLVQHRPQLRDALRREIAVFTSSASANPAAMFDVPPSESAELVWAQCGKRLAHTAEPWPEDTPLWMLPAGVKGEAATAAWRAEVLLFATRALYTRRRPSPSPTAASAAERRETNALARGLEAMFRKESDRKHPLFSMRRSPPPDAVAGDWETADRAAQTAGMPSAAAAAAAVPSGPLPQGLRHMGDAEPPVRPQRVASPELPAGPAATSTAAAAAAAAAAAWGEDDAEAHAARAAEAERAAARAAEEARQRREQAERERELRRIAAEQAEAREAAEAAAAAAETERRQALKAEAASALREEMLAAVGPERYQTFQQSCLRFIRGELPENTYVRCPVHVRAAVFAAAAWR
jgi:hypothetical protein